MARKSKITKSSGNIFADLDLPDSGEHYVKAHLVMLIGQIIHKRELTQVQAAAKMGIKQPDVSKLLRGRFEGFSLQRLMLFIQHLGLDIEIKVKKPSKPQQEGRISIAA